MTQQPSSQSERAEREYLEGQRYEDKFPDEPPARERCGACGQFLRKDSLYTNRCSDCWGPEDEFL